MSQYVKATDFSVKDGLLPGNPAKIVKGTEIDDEFDAISAAIQTKADLASPTFTGSPAAPTASPGTNTTQLATTAFAAAAATAAANTALSTLGTMSTQNANNVSITGGSVTGITDITVADGGTGVSSIAANNVMLGNGTSPIQVVAPGTIGNVLTSNGSTWQSTAPQVSNSSFTGSNQSLNQSGYQKLPGGLIIQWGRNAPNGTVTFPIAFPNACFTVVATAGTNFEEFVNTIGTASFYLGANVGSAALCPWIAIGW
jgi:hypothetical protein